MYEYLIAEGKKGKRTAFTDLKKKILFFSLLSMPSFSACFLPFFSSSDSEGRRQKGPAASKIGLLEIVFLLYCVFCCDSFSILGFLLRRDTAFRRLQNVVHACFSIV